MTHYRTSYQARVLCDRCRWLGTLRCNRAQAERDAAGIADVMARARGNVAVAVVSRVISRVISL